MISLHLPDSNAADTDDVYLYDSEFEGFLITIPPDFVDEIYRWRQNQLDREDVEAYIADVEDGTTMQMGDMTPEKMRRHRDEIISRYQKNKEYNVAWYDCIQNTVLNLDWDFREEDDGDVGC